MPTQEWIRAALKERGFKLKDVAQGLNIPAPRVTDILKGNRAVQAHEVVPLAELLGINTRSLLLSLQAGEQIEDKADSAGHLPVLGALKADGSTAPTPPGLGFDSVPMPPDATVSTGLYCYIMGDGSMAAEVPMGSLVIAADPRAHYLAIVPGTLLLVRTDEGEALRQYVRDADGADWLVTRAHEPGQNATPWRFSMLGGLAPTPKDPTEEIKGMDDIIAGVMWVHERRMPRKAS